MAFSHTLMCVVGGYMLAAVTCINGAGPEQIHLSYGRSATLMRVTWSTLDNTQDSVVKYGTDVANLDQQADGTCKAFVDGGSEQRSQNIHNVLLTGLTPGQKYYYKCGSDAGYSDVFSFTAMPSGSDWSPKLLLYGDLGKENAVALSSLKAEDNYDAIFHLGDIAYDMYNDNGRLGDAFMNMIQPLAAYRPYMTCPGNHEEKYNFSNYKNRFSMPFDEYSDNMFYSFNMGPAHLVSINTEYFFFTNYGTDQIDNQYQWLEQDLQNADRAWIIVMGHRPMYCTTTGNDCSNYESVVRQKLEKLFKDYDVDIAVWAHEHIYRRYWPIYDKTVYKGSDANPYTNPGATVHIVTSSAGVEENRQAHSQQQEKAEWVAKKNSDYGFTRLTIHNTTHVSFQQVSAEQNGAVVDSFTIIKQ